MKVLIIKTSALGDVVQALEALCAFADWIKEKRIEIDWVIEKPAAALVALSPLVSYVHLIDTKKWRSGFFTSSTWQEAGGVLGKLRYEKYDVIIDLQANTKSAIISLLARGQKRIGFNYSHASEWPASVFLTHRIKPSKEYGARGVYLELLKEGLGLNKEVCQLQDLMGVHGPKMTWRFDKEPQKVAHKLLEGGAFGLFAMGSRWPNKQIPLSLAREMILHILSQKKQRIFLVFGSNEEKTAAEELVALVNDERVKLLSKVSLVDLAAIISMSSWMVSADSLALHLASLMGAATFGVFGPSSSNFYAPPAQNTFHSSWQGPCPYGYIFEKRCPKLRTCQTAACIKGADTKSVLEPLDRWLATLH